MKDKIIKFLKENKLIACGAGLLAFGVVWTVLYYFIAFLASRLVATAALIIVAGVIKWGWNKKINWREYWPLLIPFVCFTISLITIKDFNKQTTNLAIFVNETSWAKITEVQYFPSYVVVKFDSGNQYAACKVMSVSVGNNGKVQTWKKPDGVMARALMVENWPTPVYLAGE